tara:strand:+ start:3926 stop:4171 length:246 start_codon:yes stop_codon:yes gene_type:complete
MHSGNLVEIEWYDAFEMSAGWHTLNEVNKIKPPIMVSVGYLIKETDDFITICADINKDPKENDRGRCQTIPKNWIKRKDII